MSILDKAEDLLAAGKQTVLACCAKGLQLAGDNPQIAICVGAAVAAVIATLANQSVQDVLGIALDTAKDTAAGMSPEQVQSNIAQKMADTRVGLNLLIDSAMVKEMFLENSVLENLGLLGREALKDASTISGIATVAGAVAGRALANKGASNKEYSR